MAIIRQLIIGVIFFLIILIPLTISASWIGPFEIIQGEWGSSDKEFGFKTGDTKDQFAWDLSILFDGKIIVDDWINNRFKIYLVSGRYLKSFAEPGYRFYTIDKDKIVTFKWNNQTKSNNIGVYNISKEKWEWVDNESNYKYVNSISLSILNGNIYCWDGKNGNNYSFSGQVLKTYDTRPLELGVTKEESLGGGKYKTTIQYPDKTYITDRLTYNNYLRGCDDTLYATLYKEIVRYDADSKLTAELVVPETEYKIIRPAGGGFNEVKELIVEYGDPVLAPNGDVYTWKRTPDKYSIIKWVWVDGPECPQYLDVTPTKTSLKFTWQKPMKDVDKVTGYQLLQSYNICGPFRQVVELKKDKLSYEDKDVKKSETYYYIVKAIRGKDYSGNSNKVCGQIE